MARHIAVATVQIVVELDAPSDKAADSYFKGLLSDSAPDSILDWRYLPVGEMKPIVVTLPDDHDETDLHGNNQVFLMKSIREALGNTSW